jgi:hypothetical protein
VRRRGLAQLSVCDIAIVAKKEQIVSRTTLNRLLISGGFILLALVCATAARRNLGYSELSDGRGGTNVEAVSYTEEDGVRQSQVFKGL